jgi:hypothetical protein
MSLIGTADAMSNGGDTNGTLTNGNTVNIADCEHRGPFDRVIVADNVTNVASPVLCTYCDGPALNGTVGQSAIHCNSCGANICEHCNDPSQDSDEE